MWKSSLIYKMLPIYIRSSYVDEIIIINNTEEDVFFDEQKVKVLNMRKNIYVNPAWNLGRETANSCNTLILANDDIVINDFDKMMSLVVNTKYNLIGAMVNNTSLKKDLFAVNRRIKFPRNHFGCFMIVRKYHKIPKELLILCGDDYLYYKAKLVGRIGGRFIHTKGKTTISSDNFKEIQKNDLSYFKTIRQGLR